MLFSFFCRKVTSNHRSITLSDFSKTQLRTPPFNASIRYYSSLKTEVKQSFTISYLINSCGLSPDAAKSASRNVLFDNPTNPDSVLSLFRDLGLTQNTHVSKVIRNQPQLLLLNVNKTILPKLQFLRSVGFSSKDLQILMSSNPYLLTRSLDQYLIPCCNVLKSLLLSEENVVRILKRLTLRDGYNVNNLNLNISVLRGLGMPQSIISSFITRCPNAVWRDVDKFNKGVKEVVEMGFDPLKYTFVKALIAKVQLSPRTWKCKIDAFRRWDLSEDEILSAFRKYPHCMSFSEESITNKMDFLVNRMGWQPAVILKNPAYFTYSLEKRIAPRCSVVRVLLLKGLIKPKICLVPILAPTDDSFLEKYVFKYQEQVPELLDVFHGKVDLKELGFAFDEKSAASPV